MPPSEIKSYIKGLIRQLPHCAGVYLMKDQFGEIIYVGKAKDLKKRVSQYFHASAKNRYERPKVSAMIDLIYDIEVIEVKNEAEALLLEGRLIKEYQPRYNTDFTDYKQFLLVRVGIISPFPKFKLCPPNAL